MEILVECPECHEDMTQEIQPKYIGSFSNGQTAEYTNMRTILCDCCGCMFEAMIDCNILITIQTDC